MNFIEVYKFDKNAKIPTKANKEDAGFDLYSIEDIYIKMGETKKIKTGISLNIPPGYVGKIEDRSSMALKGLRTGGGIIDAGYSGEISVVMHNFSANNTSITDKWYHIKSGDKIAQIIIQKIESPEIIIVDKLWTSQRGLYGFGSSDK